jgi:hypothetical protein
VEGSPTVWQEDVSRCNILSLSLAGTAAVALASLSLAVSPASAAKVTEGTSESISVVEAASNASQFNLKTQGASTVLVARRGERNDGGRRKVVVPAFLTGVVSGILEFFGIQTTAVTAPTTPGTF